MGLKFQKATKTKSKLRLALVGPSGGGKTYTALSIASGLGKRIAVVDTERGSASKYAGKFEFDVLEPATFEPQQYIDALHAAAEGGYDVVVIDSLSHAWMGKGGALEQVDNAAKRSQSKNSFGAWREVTPQHNAMVDAIISAPLHIIATMRSKTEYVLETNERGKQVPRKIGIQPVQRDGLEYEFDVVADLEIENNDLIVGKTRCDELHGKVFRKAGKDVADILLGWLNDGTEKAAAPAAPLGNGDATATLERSVDAQWPKWVDKWEAKMRPAKTVGELLSVWADLNEDIEKLVPPTRYVEIVTSIKNECKGIFAQANSAMAQ